MINHPNRSRFTTLPALIGNDNSRERGEFRFLLAGGQLHSEYGDVLLVADGEDLLGWGDLDGPSYEVGNGVWHVNIPKAALDKARA